MYLNDYLSHMPLASCHPNWLRSKKLTHGTWQPPRVPQTTTIRYGTGLSVRPTQTKPGSHGALPRDLGDSVGSCRTGTTAKGGAMRNPRLRKRVIKFTNRELYSLAPSPPQACPEPAGRLRSTLSGLGSLSCPPALHLLEKVTIGLRSHPRCWSCTCFSCSRSTECPVMASS